MSLLLSHNAVADTGYPVPKPKNGTVQQKHAPAKALDVQVGGDHYKCFPIQPTEFAMTMGYDACLHSALKYISRHHAKGGLQDLEKAEHFMSLREEIHRNNDMHRTLDALQAVRRMSNLSWVAFGHGLQMDERADDMSVYIAVNGFTGTPEARALRELHSIHLGHGGACRSRFELAMTDVKAQYDNPKREFIPAGVGAAGLGDNGI